MSERRLRVGVAGLGRAFTLMLPTLRADPRVELIAGADPRPEAAQRFAADVGGRAYDSVAELCADPSVEVVYIATPHQHHAAHAQMAAARGKHVLVEKPMALTLDECRRMIDAAARANVHLIVGHSHSFDRPILRTREIITQRRGRLGKDDQRAELHRLSVPAAPPRGTRHRRAAAAPYSARRRIRSTSSGCWAAGTSRACVRSPERGTRPVPPRARMRRCSVSKAAHSPHSPIADTRISTAMNSAETSARWARRRTRSRYGAARRNLRRAADPEAELAFKNARNFGGVDFAGDGGRRPAPGTSTSATSSFPASARICVRCPPA